MKTQKLLWAALALACTFTFSCKKDNGNNSGNNESGKDSKATQALVYTYFQVTKDMYENLNVKFIIQNPGDQKREFVITNDGQLEASTSDKYKFYKVPLAVGSFPGTTTVKTEITVKDGVDINAVEKLDFYKGYKYQYATYDAANQQVEASGVESKLSNNPTTSTGAKFKALLDAGSVNQELSFAFDANGKCTFKHN